MIHEDLVDRASWSCNQMTREVRVPPLRGLSKCHPSPSPLQPAEEGKDKGVLFRGSACVTVAELRLQGRRLSLLVNLVFASVPGVPGNQITRSFRFFLLFLQVPCQEDLTKLLCKKGSQLRVLKPRVSRTHAGAHFYLFIYLFFAFLEVPPPVSLGIAASVVLGEFQIKKADVC